MKLLDSLSLAKSSLVLDAPSKEVALKWIESDAQMFAQWALKFGFEYCRIRFPGSKKEYRIPALLAKKEYFMNSNLQIPSLYIGEVEVYTADFLNTLTDLVERKEQVAGLVRLRDNAQIVVTSGCNLLSNPQQGTRLKREQYWHPQDLADFNNQWQQALRVDGSNTFEFSYRALVDRSSGNYDDWGMFTTRYRLFIDGQEPYHFAEGLDFATIAKPEGVTVNP